MHRPLDLVCKWTGHSYMQPPNRLPCTNNCCSEHFHRPFLCRLCTLSLITLFASLTRRAISGNTLDQLFSLTKRIQTVFTQTEEELFHPLPIRGAAPPFAPTRSAACTDMQPP